MKTKSIQRYLAALLVFSMSVQIPYSCNKMQTMTGPGTPIWDLLLAAFEDHSGISKVIVRLVAAWPASTLEKKLAKVLLREWDSDWRNGISPSIEAIHQADITDIFLRNPKMPRRLRIEITITARGSVSKVKFLDPNLNLSEREKREIIKRIKESSCRPPISNGKFISKSYEFHFQFRQCPR